MFVQASTTVPSIDWLVGSAGAGANAGIHGIHRSVPLDLAETSLRRYCHKAQQPFTIPVGRR
jgi:hypothetical protein